MILPTAVYAVIANKSKTPEKGNNNQGVNTGGKKEDRLTGLADHTLMYTLRASPLAQRC